MTAVREHERSNSKLIIVFISVKMFIIIKRRTIIDQRSSRPTKSLLLFLRPRICCQSADNKGNSPERRDMTITNITNPPWGRAFGMINKLVIDTSNDSEAEEMRSITRKRENPRYLKYMSVEFGLSSSKCTVSKTPFLL